MPEQYCSDVSPNDSDTSLARNARQSPMTSGASSSSAPSDFPSSEAWHEKGDSPTPRQFAIVAGRLEPWLELPKLGRKRDGRDWHPFAFIGCGDANSWCRVEPHDAAIWILIAVATVVVCTITFGLLSACKGKWRADHKTSYQNRHDTARRAYGPI